MRRTPGRSEQPARALRVHPGGERTPEPVAGVGHVFIGHEVGAEQRCAMVVAAERRRIQQIDPSLLAGARQILLVAKLEHDRSHIPHVEILTRDPLAIGRRVIVGELYLSAGEREDGVGELAGLRVPRPVASFGEDRATFRDGHSGPAPDARSRRSRLKIVDRVLWHVQVDGVHAGEHAVAALRDRGVEHPAGQVQAPVLPESRDEGKRRELVFSIDRTDGMQPSIARNRVDGFGPAVLRYGSGIQRERAQCIGGAHGRARHPQRLAPDEFAGVRIHCEERIRRARHHHVLLNAARRLHLIDDNRRSEGGQLLRRIVQVDLPLQFERAHVVAVENGLLHRPARALRVTAKRGPFAPGGSGACQGNGR